MSIRRIAFVLLGIVVVVFVFWKYHYRTRYVFVPNDIKVTIPEGTNIADIERLISKSGVTLRDRLLTKENLALEGTLFPDTYRFDRDSTVEDVIIRMQAVGEITKSLIIASLLEKEVRTTGDMAMVAGIIQKRLGAGMALQIDATVAYGACLPKFERGEYCDVSKINIVDNIKRDSAYNTYARTGLPDGPITNPGKMAINAALHPVQSAYWYYLSKPDGTTVFSRTLEEHNKAKAKYLR